MFDFLLFYDDCTKKFASFDDFADACEAIDPQCHVDYSTKDATFYNFAFGFGDKRQEFCEQSMGGRETFKEAALHQVKVQREFRAAMARFC